MKVLPFFIILVLTSCQSPTAETQTGTESTDTLNTVLETVTLLGDSLYSPPLEAGTALDKYETAKAEYEANPTDADALIWYGRRTAYLGYFSKAIELYTEGIQKHPEDARFYRHRGHRHISTRQYDKAIADFEKAASLVEGQADQTEPDGLPNEQNIPLTTLQGNIWYHLGLAYYLTNDLDNALRAFSNRTVTQKYDDNIVSGGHWLYMILRRQGKDAEAEAAIKDVSADMTIIENGSYHKMCLFYKNELTVEDLQPAGKSSSADDVFLYGLGNWYLYHQQDTLKAKATYQELIDKGNPFSFAYLAAEADLSNL